MKQQETAIKFDRDKWREQDLPEVLVLIPELYQIVKEIGFKLEVCLGLDPDMSFLFLL